MSPFAAAPVSFIGSSRRQRRRGQGATTPWPPRITRIGEHLGAHDSGADEQGASSPSSVTQVSAGMAITAFNGWRR